MRVAKTICNHCGEILPDRHKHVNAMESGGTLGSIPITSAWLMSADLCEKCYEEFSAAFREFFQSRSVQIVSEGVA